MHRETIRSGNGLRQAVITAPDGSTVTEQYQDGRLVERARTNAANDRVTLETYSHDAHGRLEFITDIRTGTTTYEYDDADRVILVTTPVPGPGQTARVTENHYDPMGRVTNTVTSAGEVVHLYDAMGQLTNTYGAMTYPVGYGYDAQGRLETLRTWQDHAGHTGEAVTTWTHHPSRGWLSGKTYHGAAGPTYDYTNGGRLDHRSWARNVDTDYDYTHVGELWTILYGDGTPPVTHAYDRRGRIDTTADGMGIREFGYHPTGQTEREEFQSGPLAGFTLHRGFDDFGRLDQLRIASPSDPNLYVVDYGYDEASRLRTVTASDDLATYAYVPDSTLIGSVAFTNAGVERMAIARDYDLLDRVTNVVSTTAGSAVFTRYAYRYNAAGLRERIELADGTYWDYGYDSLGQVTSGVRRVTGEPEPWLSFGYGFDDIGNREYATAHGATSTYQANLLNQYSQRTVPGVAALIGSVNPNANLTVDNQPAARIGDYFLGLVPFDNSALSVYTTSTVVGVVNDVNAAGEDAVTEVERRVRLPKALQEFVHDADGNLETDTQWDYGWDAENRLRWMQTAAVEQNPHVPWRRIDYAYDAQGRRCRKTVTDAAQTVLSDTLYLYDAWNLLAELDAADGNALIRTYVWGLDLSGTSQGAGGVGELLYVTDHRTAKTYSVAMDGNGNVAGLVDTSNGAGAVTYQYDPFGSLLEETTPLDEYAVGNRRSGIAAQDWENGPGYILFSEESVHQRFAAQPPASGNADHFIAVRRQNNQWVYDTNMQYVPFTPRPTDILVAACDFTANTVNLLAGTLGESHGIARGYLSGDLDIIPESFGGQHDEGEFELVAGTAFTVPAPKPDNPFRFSTKYTEEETGLVYYGYRWYDSVLGRWLNRDPIQEQGGLNLLAFLLNEPIGDVDYLGNIGWRIVRFRESECGGFVYDIQYRLTRAMGEYGGWLIQKVCKDYRINLCPCLHGPPRILGDCYWEALVHVPNDSSVPIVYVTDRFSSADERPSWGSKVKTGEVMFYRARRLPSEFKTGAVSEAPNIPATRSQPAFWGNSVPSTKVSIEWGLECCENDN